VGRLLRREYPEALWQTTSRGNERREIFRDGGDRKNFSETLADYCNRFNIYIRSFVVMKHPWLIIRPPPSTQSLRPFKSGKLFGGIHYAAISRIVVRLKQEIHDDKDCELAVLLDRVKVKCQDPAP